MSKIGLQLIAAVLADDSGPVALRKVDTAQLRKSEQPVYDYVLQHINKYQVMPDVATVVAKTGVPLPTAKEPVDYYVTECQKRHNTLLLNKAIMEIHAPLAQHDPDTAVQKLLEIAGKFMMRKAEGQIMNMLEAPDKMMSWYKAKMLTGYSGIESGWPYLDLRMGGLEPGDVMSIIGRPAQGKTMLLLAMALHAWKNQGANVLMITPEMKPTKIVERLTAMYTGTALTPLANAEMSPQGFEKNVVSRMEPIKNLKNNFWIVDGAYAPTIEDLFLLCTQLKPEAVYYDGAYLMKNKNPKLNKWDRMAETVLGLKDVASSMDIPVVASYQFSRAAVKKSKSAGSDIPGLEDIYGSDEIGQTSSIVLGLLEAETVENLLKKTCTLLKGRGGEKGSWDINWDFLKMNFNEIVEDLDATKQLKFM